jgi:DNA-binding CsgD family transcriptional regulator
MSDRTTPLTPKEHQAWQLHTRGMSTYNIAAALGISRAAVRDRLQRAQRKLREQEPAT